MRAVLASIHRLNSGDRFRRDRARNVILVFAAGMGLLPLTSRAACPGFLAGDLRGGGWGRVVARPGLGWSGRLAGRSAACLEQAEPLGLAVPGQRQVQGQVAAAGAR